MNKINWKEVCKFLSGAFFVFACTSWYFAYYKIDVAFMGMTVPHEFSAIHVFTFCFYSYLYFILAS